MLIFGPKLIDKNISNQKTIFDTYKKVFIKKIFNQTYIHQLYMTSNSEKNKIIDRRVFTRKNSSKNV